MISYSKKFDFLVIEDNPGDLLLVTDYLNERFSDCEIVTAGSFKVAAENLKAGNGYDIILLDLSLPDKKGEDLVKAILALAGNIPVNILTGNVDLDFSIKSLNFGVSDYLIKDELTADGLFKSIIYTLERNKISSRLKESEERFSSLFERSPQPMWVYDPQSLRFIQVNKAAVKNYGYSESEFLNMTLYDIRPISEIAILQSTLHEKLINNNDNYSGVFKHRKKSSEIIDVEIYSTKIILGDREYRLVIALDITQKLHLQNLITKAIIKTQEDERYEIGSELHDNVCQILASTHMMIGLLQEHVKQEGLEFLQRSRENISLSVNEIRNLSHRLAPAIFDDSNIVSAIEVLVENMGISRNAEVQFDIDPRLNAISISRELQLNIYRLFQEQLNNIAKYARARQVDLSMQVEDHSIAIVIRDNGVGFDMAQTKRGIGLSNIKRRAELFGGSINLVSAPGKGCQLSIKIPLS